MALLFQFVEILIGVAAGVVVGTWLMERFYW